jgi:hypothetical protein
VIDDRERGASTTDADLVRLVKRRHHMRMYPAILLVVGLSLSACDDGGSPSADGTLRVSTASGGNDPDQDGYLLTVDGGDPVSLAATGTVEIDLAAGQHTLRLLGMAEHCSVSPQPPLDVDVPSGDTTSVAFDVTCSVTGVRITTTTTGLDFDSDGYRVEVDGTDREGIGPNGTVLIRLDAGSRSIALTGLSPNCTIQSPGSRTVIIGDTEIAPIDFAAICTATSGVIGVVVEASGTDVEGSYEARVDGERPFPVLLSEPAYLPAVPPGDHVVSLVPPPNCSVETDPQPVTVTGGALIRDTVHVTFQVICEPGFGTLRITAPTTGPIPTHDYIVFLCDSGDIYDCVYFFNLRLGDLAPNDTLVARVAVGTHRLLLEGIPANCTLARNILTGSFMVAVGDTLDFEFKVTCSP